MFILDFENLGETWRVWERVGESRRIGCQ